MFSYFRKHYYKSSDSLPSGIITADLVPPHIINNQQVAIKAPTKPSYQMSLDEVEKAHVEFVLQATNWHKDQACQILGHLAQDYAA